MGKRRRAEKRDTLRLGQRELRTRETCRERSVREGESGRREREGNRKKYMWDIFIPYFGSRSGPTIRTQGRRFILGGSTYPGLLPSKRVSHQH
jgi:hypothetical protein